MTFLERRLACGPVQGVASVWQEFDIPSRATPRSDAKKSPIKLHGNVAGALGSRLPVRMIFTQVEKVFSRMELEHDGKDVGHHGPRVRWQST